MVWQSVSEQPSQTIEVQSPMQMGKAALRSVVLSGAVLFAVMGAISGCMSSGDELLADVDGKQSIEVIVALNRAGIRAERSKATGRGERYIVKVGSADYGRAMQVLHDFQLPSRDEETLEELTAPKGFVPNSRELSGLRLDHALALEVERLLSALPGVAEARVVVRSNLVSQDVASAKASVVIRYLSPSGTVPFGIEEVKKIVVQIVPGITSDGIEVVPSRLIIPGVAASSMLEGAIQGDGEGELAPLSPFLPFMFKVATGERERALWQLGGMLVMFSCAGGIIGAYFGIRVMRGLSKRRASKGEKRNSFFLEASVKADSKTGAPVALTKGQAPAGGKDLTKSGL